MKSTGKMHDFLVQKAKNKNYKTLKKLKKKNSINN